MITAQKKAAILLGGILALALVLRLLTINQSFWLDEAINVVATRDLSFKALLTQYTIGDFHPPLYHLLLWSWFRFLPANEITARLPSVAFGLGTIVIAWMTAESLREKNDRSHAAAIIAAILLATSGLHIYYSQEARMYAQAAFFTTLTLFAFVKLKERRSKRRILLYLGSLVLLLLTDYQPWLLLPLLLVHFPGLTSIGILATVPWWPVLVKQIENGIATAKDYPAWGSLVGGLDLKAVLLVPVKFFVGRVSIDNNLVFATALLLPAAVSVILVIKCVQTRQLRKADLVGWIVLPLFLGVVVSLKVPIFAYFRFLFILPVWYLVVSLSSLNLKQKAGIAVVSILLATNLIGSFFYLTMPKFQRENWREAVAYMKGSQPNRTLVIIPNLAQAAALNYYSSGGLRIEDRVSVKLTGDERQIFLIRYVAEIFDPENELDATLENAGYRKVRELTFDGSIVIWQYEQGGRG